MAQEKREKSWESGAHLFLHLLHLVFTLLGQCNQKVKVKAKGKGSLQHLPRSSHQWVQRAPIVGVDRPVDNNHLVPPKPSYQMRFPIRTTKLDRL